MSLKPSLIETVPADTVRVARAAFPKGNLYISMRDELGVLFEDSDFAELFPRRGQPASSSSLLILIRACASFPFIVLRIYSGVINEIFCLPFLR